MAFWNVDLICKMKQKCEPTVVDALSRMWREWDMERSYKERVEKTKELDEWYDKVLALCRRKGLTLYSLNGILVVTAFELYKCPELWYRGRTVENV